jgi:hypothetical protein
MDSPVPGLDNREFALVAWILFGLAASLFHRGIRTSIGSLLLEWKLLLIFGSMALYLVGLIFLLSAASLWATALLSETVFWYLFSGLVILFRAVQKGGEENFFKKTVLSLIAITAISEFLLNLRPLNLVLELLLVPSLVLLGGTLALAETQPNGRHTRRFFQGLITALMLFLLLYTLVGMVTKPREFLTYENLLEFLLPILLTVGLIPYVYVAALLTTYGSLFSRLNWKLDGRRDIRRYAKWRVIRTAHVRLRRASQLASRFAWLVAPNDDRAAIDRAILKSMEPVQQ